MDNAVPPKVAELRGRKDAVVDILRDTLIKLVPDQQPRWHKGTANLVYTYIVVSIILRSVCLLVWQ